MKYKNNELSEYEPYQRFSITNHLKSDSQLPKKYFIIFFNDEKSFLLQVKSSFRSQNI